MPAPQKPEQALSASSLKPADHGTMAATMDEVAIRDMIANLRSAEARGDSRTRQAMILGLRRFRQHPLVEAEVDLAREVNP